MHDPGTDPLSQLAHQLINSAKYDKLTTQCRRASFTRSPELLLTVPVVNPAAAWAMLAGLYLRNDDLEQSHEIAQKSPPDFAPFPHQTPSKTGLKVQSVETVQSDKALKSHQLEDMTTSLAFWHAIMHRREGDFSNAKYWYARCRNHPAYGPIAEAGRRALERLADGAKLQYLVNQDWDADAFVDVVEAVHRTPANPLYGAAVRLQRAEWDVLAWHCARAAVASV